MCYNFLTRARERSGAGPANQRRRRSKTMSPERGWTLVQRRVVRPRINEHRKALTPPNPEETSFWSQLQGKIRQTPSYDYDRNQQTNQRMNRLPYTPPPIKLPPRKHDNYENKNKKYHVVRKKDNMVSPSEFWNDHYQKIKDNDHPRTGHKRWLNNNRKNQQTKGKGKKTEDEVRKKYGQKWRRETPKTPRWQWDHFKELQISHQKMGIEDYLK